MEKITVLKSQKLWEVIEKAANDKENLCMFYLDNVLIDKSKLMKTGDEENAYEFEQDEYKLVVFVEENDTQDWYCLLKLNTPEGDIIYSLRSSFLQDYICGKCGCRDIYIRKRGSKTQIKTGEE